MALEQRATASDLELLLDAARHGNQDQQYVAFRGLKRLAHPAALPVLCTYFQTFPQRPGFVFGAAVQAIAALPPDQTLSLARDWFRADNEVQRLVARRILAKHATFAELTHCREALQAALQKGTPNLDYYLICDMLQALQRLPEEGPYPEAEVAFQEACYSRTRIYASEVLANSDRAHFSETTAVECLWDCEDQVREIGCDNVNGQIADVYQRLQILAGDPLEEEAVSAVARSRLAEGHGLEPTF
jgi:hypothetical protein